MRSRAPGLTRSDHAAEPTPKSVDVENFAVKLTLLAKRLNWSRAKLAQQVGVDKSLAARWLNGNSRPSGNSLMQLTSAVAQAIDGFTRPIWDLTAEQLSRRLGIAPSAAAASVPVSRLVLTGLRNPPPARPAIEGFTLNGVRPHGSGINAGGHGGAGLNGQVIAIEL